MKAIDWNPKDQARALLIGHDPRLQSSNTIAEYALFADYFFRPEPKGGPELRKFGLAKSTFEQIIYLTNALIKSGQVYVTNLCNDSLPPAPNKKTVFIPEKKARGGLTNIQTILKNYPTINYVFPMSLQVNYWLQKLNFYRSQDDFLEKTEPKKRGIENDRPFFEPGNSRTFMKICGNQYKVVNGRQIVIPILHPKNFPLKGRFAGYNKCYQNVISYFNNL